MTAMIVLTLATAAMAAPATNKGKADDNKIFAAKCVTCHGKDAKGNKSMANMFKVDQAKMDLTSESNQKRTDAELAKIITDGNGKMPSFKGKLKDGEISSVVAYIRSLAPVSKPEAKSEAKPDAKPEAQPEAKPAPAPEKK